MFDSQFDMGCNQQQSDTEADVTWCNQRSWFLWLSKTSQYPKHIDFTSNSHCDLLEVPFREPAAFQLVSTGWLSPFTDMNGTHEWDPWKIPVDGKISMFTLWNPDKNTQCYSKVPNFSCRWVYNPIYLYPINPTYPSYVYHCTYGAPRCTFSWINPHVWWLNHHCCW